MKLVRQDLDTEDISILERGVRKGVYRDASRRVMFSSPLDKLDTPILWYHFLHTPLEQSELDKVRYEIDMRSNLAGSYSARELEDLKESAERS
ncbi:MAG: hypothetical protein AABX11_06525 [Nanoarchaeota archaeon]